MCCYFVIKTCQHLHDIMTAVCFTAKPGTHEHKLIARGEKERARVSAGLHQLSGGRVLCLCAPALPYCKEQNLRQLYAFSFSIALTHTLTHEQTKWRNTEPCTRVRAKYELQTCNTVSLVISTDAFSFLLFLIVLRCPFKSLFLPVRNITRKNSKYLLAPNIVTKSLLLTKYT